MIEVILAVVVGIESTVLTIGYFAVSKYIANLKLPAAAPSTVIPVVPVPQDNKKILTWLEAIPQKAEVAVRREAALLAAELKAKS